MNDALYRFNNIDSKEAEAELLKCCGSSEWAKSMADKRPFSDVPSLIEQARITWWTLSPDDWLEAFRHHPKIGEQKAENQTSEQANRWSKHEQSAAANAAADTKAELAELNRQYETKFGFIFIVCATGKSSAEMLSILRTRLDNSPDQELRTAASEQAKILELRLHKLLNQ